MAESLLAIAVAAALPVVAHAQVTLSGSISTGIIDNGLPGSKATVGRFAGGGNSISVNAVDDIGGGLKAGFASQMRFNPIDGDEASDGGTGGNLFHAVNAYISGGFGSFTVGKIGEASSCAFDPFMCTTGAGSLYTGFSNGLTGAAARSSVSYIIGASTQNNSIMYRTPTISGFSAGLQTTVNRPGEDRQHIDLNYAAGPITAQYMLVNWSPAHSAAGATGTKATDQLIGIKYDAKVVAVSFVNSQKENAAGTKTANINYLAALVPMGAFSIAAAYATDSKAADTNDTAWALGVNYPMGKRTLLGFDVFEKELAGGSTGFAARIRHTF